MHLRKGGGGVGPPHLRHADGRPDTPPSPSWRDILHLVDIVCCCAILFPIVWSIKQARRHPQPPLPHTQARAHTHTPPPPPLPHLKHTHAPQPRHLLLWPRHQMPRRVRGMGPSRRRLTPSLTPPPTHTHTPQLRDGAESDGKARRVLHKLTLFRQFYIMVRRRAGGRADAAATGAPHVATHPPSQPAPLLSPSKPHYRPLAPPLAP